MSAPDPAESLVRSLRGRDWLRLPEARREEVVEVCFRYWRARGFPHYRLDRAEIAAEYERLAAFDVSRAFAGAELKGAPLGLRLANSFHPHMWSVTVPGVRSPVERFDDDAVLRKVLRKALRVFAERPAVNESNLRRMLQTYSRTARVSNFRVTAAKALYARYSGAGDRVVDFSSGYGGRLLGCLTLDRDYLGIDPCRPQVQGLRRMLGKLARLVNVRGRGCVHQACAEDFLPGLPARSCSLVFSSPPYFDKERYSSETTQSYVRFPRYEEWTRGFLQPVIEQAHRILEPGGHLILNVANIRGYKIADDALALARRHFRWVETCRLRLGQRPYLRSADGEPHRYEPIFVFRKARSRPARPLRDTPCWPPAPAPSPG